MAGLALPRPPARRLRVPTGPGRVLIADADHGRRGRLRTNLQQAGLEVVAEAQDGAEVIALTASHRPTVVVLDDVLPVRRGVDALPRIRRLVPHALIAVYGPAAAAVEDVALGRGADAVVDDGVEGVVELVSDHFAIVL